MATLQNLPDENLVQISKELDFRTLLNLRKVCRHLRSFIDSNIPSSSITEIYVRINTKHISLRFWDPKARENWTETKYKSHNKGCSTIQNSGNKKLKKLVANGKQKQEKESFTNVFWEDFQVFLKHQKSILEKFSVVFEHYESKTQDNNKKEQCFKDFMDSFQLIMKTRKRPFQVKTLDFGVNNQTEIISILPFVDPKSLEKIIIGNSERRKALEINEVLKLELWKKAKEVEFEEFSILAPIQSFSTFSKVTFSMDTVTTETIRELRKIFHYHPTMSYFEIYYNPIEQDLRTLFGHRFDGSYTDEQGGERWFFKISDNQNDIISIQSNLFSWLRLTRVKTSELPENAKYF